MASTGTERLKEPTMKDCLAQMDALAEELRKATRAIEQNLLEQFEQSVVRQRERSAALALTVARLRAGPPGRDESLNPDSLRLETRLREAARNLLGLNLQYAALLEHSGRSLRMFESLYRSAPARETATGLLQTWSCEA